MDLSLTMMVSLTLKQIISRLRLTRILGCFLYEDLIPDRKLSDTVLFLEGEEKEAFLDLARGMLAWHPDARKTAGELVNHPFLQPKQSA